MNWLAQMEARRLVLSLRELLVRHDENLAAHTLMQECVPFLCDGDPEIGRARAEQAAMVDHIVGDSYAEYYATNSHERPFEDQYGIEPEAAHEQLYRVGYLRKWAQEQEKPPRLLDLACNDGWMAKNLEGLAIYHGVDLNPHCIERAKARDPLGARFRVGFAEDAPGMIFPGLRTGPYDAVIAYELIEHVRDPDAVLEAMVACCRPGGSLFVSTPLGATEDGDLPQWWHVEPKGHVRVYTPKTFHALLARHGEVESIELGPDRVMVARVTVPG